MWKIRKIVKKGDYNYAIVFGHPFSTENSYVLHHRIVVENHLGRLLNPNEIVHHKNGIKTDNRIENLEVMSNVAHARLHATTGNQMSLVKCPCCKIVFEIERKKTCNVLPNEWTSCSPSCRGRFSRMIQLDGRTHEVEKAISENIVSEYYRISDDNSEEIKDNEIRRGHTPSACDGKDMVQPASQRSKIPWWLQ